jgi:signal transduction histidine kinase
MTLMAELAVMGTAFTVVLALLLAIVGVSNRRLMADYRQERRLSHAVKSAEEADRIKSVFLADISHELRTPLNSIIGFSEIMREEVFGPIGNEKYRNYANDIHQSGRHLLAMISDLFDLSCIQTGQTEMTEALLDLAECLQTTTRMLSRQPEAAALVFTFDIQPRLPEILADRQAIRHVLQNILANAIKYTLEGTITISAKIRPDGGLEFAVSDTGIGIPDDELINLTQRFNQIDETWKRKFEGTGLGLALVKAWMARHDGNVTITSEVGVGTTVACNLPQQRVLLTSDKQGRAA